jgi:diamine N-acetyltransferase
MVHLERLTRDNWQQVITLDIADDQRRFLETPSVLYGVAEVQFHPTYMPYAVYDGDTVIGFAVYGYLPEDRMKWWIPLFLIDHRYQGKGYGRAAMQTIITSIRQAAPDCREIALSYKPDNTVAERLYLSLGFEKTDEIDERGQVTARLYVRQSVLNLSLVNKREPQS